MVSQYVPFVHIKNGTLGIKGHVCSFPQRVQDLHTILPRLPSSATFVKMVRNFKGEEGNFGVKSFTVRQAAVLCALNWLKNTINFTKSLSQLMSQTLIGWMVLKRLSYHHLMLLLQKKKRTFTLFSLTVDQQRFNVFLPWAVKMTWMNLKPVVFMEDASPLMSEEDTELCNIIKIGTKSMPSLPWPYVSPDPVNEYDTTEKKFCNAFPWLFPGGVGDFNDYRERKISATDWVARMLQYEDGRLASDKMWCFFALNYSTRRRNQTSGLFCRWV
jgi:hypothetical protein